MNPKSESFKIDPDRQHDQWSWSQIKYSNITKRIDLKLNNLDKQCGQWHGKKCYEIESLKMCLKLNVFYHSNYDLSV